MGRRHNCVSCTQRDSKFMPRRGKSLMACQLQRLPFREAAVIAFSHPEGVEVYAPEGQIPHGVPSSSRTSYCSRRRFFSESSSLTHFVAPPPKTGPAFAGLRFCFVSGGSRSFKRLLQVLRLPFREAAVIAFSHPEGVEVYAPEGQIPHGVPERKTPETLEK